MDVVVDVASEVRRRIIAPAVALFTVVAVGGFGYYLLGDGAWSLEDCFYMAVITLTTVGYSETLAGFHEVDHAREFTMLFIVLGMGTFLYFASTVTAVIIEGDLKRAFRYRRMHRRIRSMKNHYIVCGIGSTGSHVMEELIVGGKPCVAIDTDRERLDHEAARHKEGEYTYVVGDATDDEVLAAANIDEAAGVVAALSNDKDNLYLVVAVRAANPRARIVARGSDVHVLDKLRKAGAHSVISPNYIGGMRMASVLLRPHVVKFLDEMLRDAGADYRIEEINLPQGTPMANQRLGDTGLRTELDIGVLAVLDPREDRYTYNPGADFVLEARQTLVVLGPMKSVITLRQRANGMR